MALLYNARNIMAYARNVPKVIKKIYLELAALDTRITNLDTENNTEHFQVRIPADSAASDTWERAIFKVPSAGNLVEIVAVPDTDIGQATNYMTLDVQEKGADGAGTTSMGSLAVNSTNTIEGMVGRVVVDNLTALTADRVLSLKKTVASAGQVWPGGIVRVKFTRT